MIDVRVELRAHPDGGYVVGVRNGEHGVFYRQWKRTASKKQIRKNLDVAARQRREIVAWLTTGKQ